LGDTQSTEFYRNKEAEYIPSKKKGAEYMHEEEDNATEAGKHLATWAWMLNC
jgi:hypothetical protein